MKRSLPADPYLEAKLLGILLAGVLGQTRSECSAQSGLRQDLRPSGIHRIAIKHHLYDPDKPPKA
jgi:hypothetical protein